MGGGVEPFLRPGLLFSDCRENSYLPPLAGVWFEGGRRMLRSGTASQSQLPPSSSAPVFLESLLPRGPINVLSVTSYAGRWPLFLGASEAGLLWEACCGSALRSCYPSLLPEARWPQDPIWRGKWETHLASRLSHLHGHRDVLYSTGNIANIL